MSTEKKISRRDFLKLGGIGAISLPIINKLEMLGENELLESQDLYGGFLVTKITKHDEALYQVDDEVYQRFHSKYAIFSRLLWDQEYSKKASSAEKSYKINQPGYSKMDSALSIAAALVANFEGTNTLFPGAHGGLLKLNHSGMVAPFGPVFEGKWDHSHLSPEEMAESVKKAALFLGASLVGIAPMDERWIYSGYFDMMSFSEAPIEITEVEQVELPEGQVSPQEAGDIITKEMRALDGEAIKEIIVGVLENTDPMYIPDDAPPIGMVKILPAEQFKERLYMFSSMPTPVLRGFADRLGLDFEIADVDLGETAKPRYLKDGTLAIPETMKTVIVLAFEMDYDSINAAPSPMGDIGAMDAYSKMAITAGSLALFIQQLGFNAIPCGNNTGLSVPQAIDAGLGEAGRHGLLITPKYGPRVRLAKVITDMPMAYDKPIRFGVSEFCEVCGKCAETCPTKAIPFGPKTSEAINVSNNPGVKKWVLDGEACYIGWNITGSGCGNCIRVCPFNKPEGWLHSATRILIGAANGPLDKLLLNLDDASGFGSTQPNFDFWDNENYIHIKK